MTKLQISAYAALLSPLLAFAQVAPQFNTSAPSVVTAPQPQVWFKGDTLTSGSTNVTSWADSSGNGYAATQSGLCSTSPSTPLTAPTIYNNNRTVLRFTTSSPGTCLAFQYTGTPAEVWVVAMAASNTVGGLGILGADSTSATPRTGSGGWEMNLGPFGQRNFQVNRTTEGYNPALNATLGTIAYNNIGYYLLMQGELTTVGGHTVNLAQMGVSIGTANAASGTLAPVTNVYLGNETCAAVLCNPLIGDIAEVLIWNVVLTAPQKAAWQAYLSTKYFVQTPRQQYSYATFDNSNVNVNYLSSPTAGTDWTWIQPQYSPNPSGLYVTTMLGGPTRDDALLRWYGTAYLAHSIAPNAGVCSSSFDIAQSSDEGTWTYAKTVDMSSVTGACSPTSNPGRVWAFKWFYDTSALPHVVIPLSSTGEVTGSFSLYESHPTTCGTTPLTCITGAWSLPATINMPAFPSGTSQIDPSIFLQGSTYWAFVNQKDNSKIGLAHSTSYNSGWSIDNTNLLGANSGDGNENPVALRIGNGNLRMYFAGGGVWYSDCAVGQLPNACTWTTPTKALSNSPTPYAAGYGAGDFIDGGTVIHNLGNAVNAMLAVGGH